MLLDAWQIKVFVFKSDSVENEQFIGPEGGEFTEESQVFAIGRLLSILPFNKQD